MVVIPGVDPGSGAVIRKNNLYKRPGLRIHVRNDDTRQKFIPSPPAGEGGQRPDEGVRKKGFLYLFPLTPFSRTLSLQGRGDKSGV